MALLSLANETLMQIVEYLDQRDISSACLVNKRFYDLIGEYLYRYNMRFKGALSNGITYMICPQAVLVRRVKSCLYYVLYYMRLGPVCAIYGNNPCTTGAVLFARRQSMAASQQLASCFN
jgi:F-box-like